ncbi:MAG TPA: amidohydrolase family protein, partial [Thermomicrobiales bacterium]|nr:amidohydrolase family protein [Thermomicrobiales bacterium]
MQRGRADAFDVERWRRRVRVAQRQEPADLVLTGGAVVDVFSEDVIKADVAVVDGAIAGVGDYPDGRERIDLAGRFVAPAFIDAHIHTESALVWISEFARAVVPRGTGAIVTDPHEIANVAGLPGLRAMRDAAAELPLAVFFTAPSCVPASAMESPGAVFGPNEIAETLAWPETVGLGELMNFPGTLAGDDEIGRRLEVSQEWRRDGHAPGVRGAALQAYAGSGPSSDHESTALAEARDKLRAGMMVMIREGSSARNLDALLPLVSDHTYPRCCFCSDDRDCDLLLHRGHMDEILRQAIASGLDPLRAIRLATWNAADYWRLDGFGAVAAGFRANLAILDDLPSVAVAMTLYEGCVVAENGRLTAPLAPAAIPDWLRETMRPAPLTLDDLRLPPDEARQAVVVIPGQIATGWEAVTPTIRDGWA